MLTAENKLLFNCLKNDPSDVKIRYFQTLRAEDWRIIFNGARRYVVIPLLYQANKNLASEAQIPPNIMQQMKEAYYIAASRNMLIYKELKIILAKFSECNIPVIILKGAHLAKFVYGNVALRAMNDLDLLVKKEDLGRASDVLIKHGYVSSQHSFSTPEAHLPPFRCKNKVRLELHFNIYRSKLNERFSVDELWERSQMISYEGMDVRVLCPEDLLIHICVHASIQHGFENMVKTLFDINSILEHYQSELDWQKLLIISRQLKVNNCLYLMLSSTYQLIGISHPCHIIAELKPSDEKMLATAQELLFGGASLINPNIAKLFGEEKWLIKAKLFWSRIFLPQKNLINDKEKANSTFRGYWKYLVRIAYLLSQYGNKVLLALMKDAKIRAVIEQENKKNNVQDWLAS